jgi:hypothetical protein
MNTGKSLDHHHLAKGLLGKLLKFCCYSVKDEYEAQHIPLLNIPEGELNSM